MITNKNILIWLNSIGISNTNIINIHNVFYDLSDLWTTKEENLRHIKGIKPEVIEKIICERKNHNLEQLLLNLDKYNIRATTIFDNDYPEKLHNIDNKPLILYSKGIIKEEDNMSIGIVGSRKATAYGKWACSRFAKELTNLGVTIVSGLASGIDAIAHQTTIEAGGRTIGVLGNGLDVVYPKSNYNLYNEISNSGVLLSEFPLGTKPYAFNFPQRNRIISGLSLGIIVIEAKEKSGSLITAHHALEQGKEVFALPGNINSIYSGGTNKLIKDGARPLLNIEDIIEEIYELQVKIDLKKTEQMDYSSLSPTELKVVKIIEEGPVHCDILSIKTGLNISTITSILTILELKGIIKELSSRTFTLC